MQLAPEEGSPGLWEANGVVSWPVHTLKVFRNIIETLFKKFKICSFSKIFGIFRISAPGPLLTLTASHVIRLVV